MRLWVLTLFAVFATSACTGGNEVSERTPSTLSTTTSAVRTATTPLFSFTWSRVPFDESVFGSAGFPLMRSVAAGGPGLVAVGQDGAINDFDAAVWTSSDGITWFRIPHDVAVFGGEGDQAMSSVTVGGPGLVAVGVDGPVSDRDAAVWTSPDGITWSRVPHNEVSLGGEGSQSMGSVIVGGPGLVAVGSESVFGNADVAVWTSPDGISWSRVSDDEGVLGGPGAQSVAGVTAGGPGLVAVGRVSVGGNRDFAVWTSPDGLIWSRVPHDESVLGGEVFQGWSSVAGGGPGLVAVGFVDPGGDRDAAVWTSPDGITWSRVPHDEMALGGEGGPQMSMVIPVEGGLVAVGRDGIAEIDVAVWTSPDGVIWSRVDHDESVFGGEGVPSMRSIAVGGPGLVAVGDEISENGIVAAVWIAVPDD